MCSRPSPSANSSPMLQVTQLLDSFREDLKLSDAEIVKSLTVMHKSSKTLENQNRVSDRWLFQDPVFPKISTKLFFKTILCVPSDCWHYQTLVSSLSCLFVLSCLLALPCLVLPSASGQRPPITRLNSLRGAALKPLSNAAWLLLGCDPDWVGSFQYPASIWNNEGASV